MATDKELLEINELINDFNVNQYTIKYDSNAKRFFKGFTPKIGWGALTSVLVTAGLGVASVATGGLALGAGLATAITVGNIASVGVTAGVVSQSIYSGFVYGKNLSKTRFKNMGLGGKAGSTGAIEVVEEHEAKAYEYTRMLELQPNTNEFTVDGQTVSRRALQKMIKEHEDIAYHGLKYILETGLEFTDKINYLTNKIDYLTKEGKSRDREKAALEKCYDVMDRVANCARTVASQRETFNPYKKLIADYLRKGCMLGYGEDAIEQNEKISVIKNMKDKDMAFKMYSNMYELDAKNELIKEREKTIKAEKKINTGYESYLNAIKQLIKYDGDIAKLTTQQRKLVEQVEDYKGYVALIGNAELIMKAMPAELASEKKAIDIAITNLEKAMITNSREEKENAKIILDNLVQSAYDKFKNAYIGRGKKINQDALDEAQANYARVSKQLSTAKQNLSKANKQTAKLTKDLGDAYADIFEAQKAERQKLNARADEVLAEISVINLKNKPTIKAHVDKVTEFKAKKKLNSEEVEQYELSLTYLTKTLKAYNEQKLAREQALHKNATQTGLRKHAENKQLVKENADLQKKLTSTTAEAQQLHDKNVRLTREKELAGTFLDGAFDTIDEQKAQLDKNATEIAKQKDRFGRAVNIARKKEQQNKTLRGNIATAVNAYVDSVKENNATKAKLSEAENERDRAISGWYEAEQDNKQKATENKKIVKEAQQLHDKNVRLTREKELAETFLDGTLDQVDELGNVISKKDAELAEKTSANAKLQKKNSALKFTAATLATKAKEVEQRAEQLLQESQASKNALKLTRKTSLGHKEENKRLVGEIEDLEDKFAKLAVKYDRLVRSSSNDKETINATAEALKTTEMTLENARKLYNSAVKSYETEKKTSDTLRGANAELSKQVASKDAELKLNTTVIDDLHKEIADKDVALKQSLDARSKAEKENKTLNAQLSKTEKQIADKDKQIDELTEHNNALVDGTHQNIQRIMELEGDLADTQQAMSHSIRKLEKQLEQVSYERDAHQQGIEDLEVKVRELEKKAEEDARKLSAYDEQIHARDYGRVESNVRNTITKAWDHIKYCRDLENADKYAESTNKMQQILENAVRLYGQVTDNFDNMQKLGTALSNEYKKVKKDGKWPEIPKATVIPGAEIPEDALDDLFKLK